jgi:cyclopropane fatty-acyl-phospholipid synthase-like methyltransferase
MFKTLGKQLRQPSGFMGKLVSRMMQLRNREFYEKMITELDVQNGDFLFEIGYGPGTGISMIAGNTANCTVHGIDFSELMCKEATKRNRKFIEKGIVSLKYGDVLSFDPAKICYDKIFCLNVIYFWKDLGPVFDKVHSMLNTGGLFCIFMTPADEIDNLKFTADFNKHQIEKVTAELKRAGFTNVEYKLDNGYYIKAKS